MFLDLTLILAGLVDPTGLPTGRAAFGFNLSLIPAAFGGLPTGFLGDSCLISNLLGVAINVLDTFDGFRNGFLPPNNPKNEFEDFGFSGFLANRPNPKEDRSFF